MLHVRKIKDSFGILDAFLNKVLKLYFCFWLLIPMNGNLSKNHKNRVSLLSAKFFNGFKTVFRVSIP